MSFVRGLKGGVGLTLVALLFLAHPTVIRAQTTSASVQGTVVDAQKGLLPGVSVTLKSKTQSEVLTAVTDGEGRFVFPIVRPDTYVLTATLQGFKTLEQSNLVVSANDKLSAGTLMLEVGALTESVQVSARSIELQSNSGERSFTMENSTLTNIANNGRMLFNFATLVPGALSQNAGAGTELGSVSGFTVNGQRPNSNNMTIDGVANIDTGDNGGNMATTNIDAVAEFKLLTNSYQAEYGRAVGGQLQVVTKSGSNVFHGSGYWYGRRPGWNANYWTNNRDGLPVPKNTRDDRGYTIGGPILKQKLFFFWSQEFQTPLHPTQHPLRDGADGPGAPGRLLAERGQQRQPVPVHSGFHDRPALQRHQYERVLPGRRRSRQDPREPRLLARPEHAQALPAVDR